MRFGNIHRVDTLLFLAALVVMVATIYAGDVHWLSVLYASLLAGAVLVPAKWAWGRRERP